MNRSKEEALAKLEKRADEVRSRLATAEDDLANAKRMKLGNDVVVLHEKDVADLRAELAAVDAQMEPLDRSITRYRANFAFKFAVVGCGAAFVGILTGLIQVFRWLGQ